MKIIHPRIGCLLQRISNLTKFKLMNYGMGYNIFFETFGMKKMGALEIEAYKYLTWRIKII